MSEYQNSREAEIIETSTPAREGEVEVAKVKKRRPFYLRFWFIASTFLLIAVIVLTVWMVNVLRVYNNSQKYEEAYDLVQQELQFCDEIEGKENKREIFNYCDEFKQRFLEIEREEETPE